MRWAWFLLPLVIWWTSDRKRNESLSDDAGAFMWALDKVQAQHGGCEEIGWWRIGFWYATIVSMILSLINWQANIHWDTINSIQHPSSLPPKRNGLNGWSKSGWVIVFSMKTSCHQELQHSNFLDKKESSKKRMDSGKQYSIPQLSFV